MNIKNALSASRKDGLSDLLIFSAMALIGYFLMNIVAMSMVALVYNKNLPDLGAAIGHPQESEGMRMAILTIQAIVSLFTFVVVPWLYITFYKKSSIKDMLVRPPRFTILLIIAIGLVYVTGPANTLLYEWNKNIIWPHFLKDFGTWAEASEATLKELTEYLINFDNPAEWLMGIFVIAVIPAIGEELFFRGVIQHKFAQLFRNHHIAIWVTAFIFSAIHFQFLGFLPRFFLGLLFGYLYVWSGSLWFAIIAHFLNNFTTLVLMNMALSGTGGFSPEDIETTSVIAALISVALSAGLLWYFYQLSHQPKHA